jgi:hypothetical protein
MAFARARRKLKSSVSAEARRPVSAAAGFGMARS